MVFNKAAIIAFLGLIALPAAFAAPLAVSGAGGSNSAAGYPTNAPDRYSGPWHAFPGKDTWVDFNLMFDGYRGHMETAGSSPSDVDGIRNGIHAAADGLNVDKRVILGIIIEESSGYVGVPAPSNMDGVPTAGLMQALGCPGFPGRTNLSQQEITDMIWCGTLHYQANLRAQGGQDAPESIYPALREYNTGSVVHENLSDGKGFSNEWYVSDIVQRMQGLVF